VATLYYSTARNWFSTQDFTTDWIKVERGIITGCTVLVILFVLGMNLILKAAKQETKGPKTTSGIRMPQTRGFMNDITITTHSHIQTIWILCVLEETASLARMKLNPRKSRYLVLRKGWIMPLVALIIQWEDIPRITDNPIKYLGKWFDMDAINSRSPRVCGSGLASRNASQAQVYTLQQGNSNYKFLHWSKSSRSPKPA